MNPEQAIPRPFGVRTYGSAIIRVDPDIASIRFIVSRTENHPKDAFKAVRESSKKVVDYLQLVDAKKEIGTSQITLEHTWEFAGSKKKFIGYTGIVGFHILLYDLRQLENLLIGLVDSGVNEIYNVDFQTNRLKELRAQARRTAVEAARVKAENYCLAAQVKLGRVIHIEDVNPDIPNFFGRRYEGHATNQNVMDQLGTGDVEDIKAFNPGSITINAAVYLSFSIVDE
jgi:uncharacterized protein